MEPTTKEEAIQQGQNKYFPGVECKHGHVTYWYVRGGCVECRSDIRKRYVAAHPEQVKTRQEEYRLKANKNTQRYNKANKEARNEYNRLYRQQNPNKFYEYATQYRQKNSDKVALDGKRYRLKTLYGISLEEYNAIVESQQGACAICGVRFSDGEDPPHLDHSHDTGLVRGVLCRACNVGLGHFKENVELLQQAISYLKNS